MPTLQWCCGACRGSRATHLLTNPDCAVSWHDGWDACADERYTLWLSGPKKGLEHYQRISQISADLFQREDARLQMMCSDPEVSDAAFRAEVKHTINMVRQKAGTILKQEKAA